MVFNFVLSSNNNIGIDNVPILKIGSSLLLIVSLLVGCELKIHKWIEERFMIK